MAVDSRNKRASCYLVGMPWRNMAPNPDGAISDAEDRVQIAWFYAGIVPSTQALVASLRGITGMRPFLTGIVGLRAYFEGKAGLR